MNKRIVILGAGESGALLAQGFDIEADQPVVDIHVGPVVENI